MLVVRPFNKDLTNNLLIAIAQKLDFSGFKSLKGLIIGNSQTLRAFKAVLRQQNAFANTVYLSWRP